jgi:hypothetical protein
MNWLSEQGYLTKDGEHEEKFERNTIEEMTS